VGTREEREDGKNGFCEVVRAVGMVEHCALAIRKWASDEGAERSRNRGLYAARFCSAKIGAVMLSEPVS